MYCGWTLAMPLKILVLNTISNQILQEEHYCNCMRRTILTIKMSARKTNVIFIQSWYKHWLCYEETHFVLGSVSQNYMSFDEKRTHWIILCEKFYNGEEKSFSSSTNLDNQLSFRSNWFWKEKNGVPEGKKICFSLSDLFYGNLFLLMMWKNADEWCFEWSGERYWKKWMVI